MSGVVFQTLPREVSAAEFNNPCTTPKVSSTILTIRFGSSAPARSPVIKIVLVPRLVNSLANLSPVFVSRPTRAKPAAPRSTAKRATHSPTPREAPLSNKTLPCILEVLESFDLLSLTISTYHPIRCCFLPSRITSPALSTSGRWLVVGTPTSQNDPPSVQSLGLVLITIT
ncbi:unannotated protein [freshwater metagenome]|uniref:Unannotated protein n=1 Tax=freshwater metagenome TaxID=449393 RepID=A0A6J7PDC7_9ZZZZ